MGCALEVHGSRQIQYGKVLVVQLRLLFRNSLDQMNPKLTFQQVSNVYQSQSAEAAAKIKTAVAQLQDQIESCRLRSRYRTQL